MAETNKDINKIKIINALSADEIKTPEFPNQELLKHLKEIAKLSFNDVNPYIQTHNIRLPFDEVWEMFMLINLSIEPYETIEQHADRIYTMGVYLYHVHCIQQNGGVDIDHNCSNAEWDAFMEPKKMWYEPVKEFLQRHNWM